MPRFCVTDPRHLILLVPFGYAFTSRYHWPRDFVVNALTAWVPGVILVALLGDLGAGPAVLTYLLGYAVFISLYELGYLANDTIGLRHDPTPRRRVDVVMSPTTILVFGTVRLGVALVAILALGVGGAAIYWATLAALGGTLIAHNTLRATEMKFFTFLQLSLFRFALPVLPVLVVAGDVVGMLICFATGLLLFTLPRFLTYLDAKGRLSLPERKARAYHLKTHLAVLPLVTLLSIATHEVAPIACLLWGVFVQLVYVARARVPAHPGGATSL